MDELGFGLRKPRKVKMMGECADRAAPLEKIGALKARYLKPGPPAVSLANKKRELVGDYVAARPVPLDLAVAELGLRFPRAATG